MNIHPSERTFAFIDGPNLHATVRALGFEIDYRKLLEHLRKQGRFLRVLYYTAIVEDQEFSTFRPLADWLDYNGYTMVTKPARGFTDSTGRRRFRTSMDVELAVDAMRLADKADHIILFSGEQSFASLVSALQQMGKRVTVVSTIETQPAMVADELRRQADQFIDIDSLQTQIARLGRTPRPPHGADRDERAPRPVEQDEERQGFPADEAHADSTASSRRDDRSEPADTSLAVSERREVMADERLVATVGGDDTPSEASAGTGGATTVVRTTLRRRRTQA